MPLYEVAIVAKATKKEIEDGAAPEKLVFGPKAVIATDPQMAGIAAVTSGDNATPIDLSRAQVLVRPFA